MLRVAVRILCNCTDTLNVLLSKFLSSWEPGQLLTAHVFRYHVCVFIQRS
jgi:hypothetical protein